MLDPELVGIRDTRLEEVDIRDTEDTLQVRGEDSRDKMGSWDIGLEEGRQGEDTVLAEEAHQPEEDIGLGEVHLLVEGTGPGEVDLQVVDIDLQEDPLVQTV